MHCQSVYICIKILRQESQFSLKFVEVYSKIHQTYTTDLQKDEKTSTLSLEFDLFSNHCINRRMSQKLEYKRNIYQNANHSFIQKISNKKRKKTKVKKKNKINERIENKDESIRRREKKYDFSNLCVSVLLDVFCFDLLRTFSN